MQGAEPPLVIGAIVNGYRTLATNGAVPSGVVFSGQFTKNTASGAGRKPVTIIYQLIVRAIARSVQRKTAAYRRRSRIGGRSFCSFTGWNFARL